PPRPKMVFSCPRECPVCQKLKGTNSRVCQAADDYGDVKNDFLAKLSTDQSDAYEELRNTSAFVVTAATKTCDGMIRHINLFAKLSRAVKDKIHDFLDDPATCTAADVEKFPREVFSALEPARGRRIFARMSLRQKAVVCKDLKYEDCLTRIYISKKIDCVKALLDNGNAVNVKDVSSLMDINNCSSWDRDTWNLTLRNFPKFLTADCIKETPNDIIMDNLDKIGDSCGTMKPKERFAFVNATRTKMEDKKSQGTLTSADKRDLSNIVSKCKSDPSALQGILDPKDALKTTDLNTMSRSKGMKYMEQALQSMSPKDFTKDEIVNSIGVLVNDKKTLKQMNDTEIEAAACEVCAKKDDLNKNDLRKFADVVMDLPAFSDPSQFDSTTFDCMGCMMAFIPTSSFSRIPDTQLRSAINSGTLKNMTITSKKMGKKVLENAKMALNKPNGDFSESDLKKLGSAVASFDSKDLDNIPDNSFTEDVIKEFDQALADDSDSGDKKSLKAKLVAKDWLRIFLRHPIQDAPISDFDDLTGDNEESTITCNRKQAKFLMKKVKDTLGDTSNDNYTLKRLTNMKPYLNGLSVQDIKNMSQDSTFLDKMHTLGKAPDMNREQTKTIHKQIKLYTKFDETDSATLSSQTDSSTVSEMAPQVLALFSKTELKKFGMANCEAILERLAEADTETMTKKEIKEKFDYFLECIWTQQLTVLYKDALEDKASTLQSCNLDTSSRKKLASNVVSKVFNSDMTQLKASGALVVGNLLSELTDAQLNQIDKDTISDTADKVSEAFKDKEDKEKKREKKGFKMDRTTDEKNSDKTKKRKVFKRILKAKEDIISAASTTSGRRKRSSVSLTCSDLQSLGSTGLSALSTTQISNLNDQEFIDCADLLGTPSDYSTSQKDALATVAKRTTVWGDPSGWNASNVYSAGSIVQALTTTEIAALTLDLDAVSRLGTFDGWDAAKISEVFSRWLTLEKSNTPSSITSSELRSLGHVSCGATTGQIAQMSSSAYQSAADAVGEVTSCTDLQLYEYALLAKTAYGSDVTTWDSSTISNLGVVIGGLTGGEISTLSETQIDSIDANDMSYIPPSVFAGFTVSQINTFDTAQGQATTSTQRSALSTSQLDALSAAAGVSFASSGGMSFFIRNHFNLPFLILFMFN
ncbi:hypothetical protein FSP39_018115, partial [Pinctada imbricata]